MILTCPECATSYFVDDGAVGQGRTVRCTGCSASWRAEPSPALELRNSPEEGAIGLAPHRRAADLSLGALGGEALPKAIRARAQDQKKVREAAAAGAVWAGIGAAFALVIVTAMVFRIDVVRLVPNSASAYAAVGLPVNPFGLTIDKAVHTEMGLQDGRQALVVTGTIRNIRTKAVESPPLAISLLDKQGHTVGRRTVRVGDALVPAGQTRSFAVSLLDPPMTARDVEVTFAFDGWKPGAAAPDMRRQAEGPSMRLRAAERGPVVAPVAAAPAQALPASSPYAVHPAVNSAH
jgi:predicted Zn finger-like uncharacterized protein